MAPMQDPGNHLPAPVVSVPQQPPSADADPIFALGGDSPSKLASKVVPYMCLIWALYALYVPGVETRFQPSARYMPDISPRYPDISPIYAQYMRNISSIYARYMPDRCLTCDLHVLCLIWALYALYVSHMGLICLICARRQNSLPR